MIQFLFGLIGRCYLLFDWSDFWNNFVQTIYSFTFLILFIYLFYKNKISMNNDIIYISVIFSILFALSPIYSIRYFYPLYILLAVVVSLKNKEKQ